MARLSVEGTVAGLEYVDSSPAYSRQQAKGRTKALLEKWSTQLPPPSAKIWEGGCGWQHCPGLILTHFFLSLFFNMKTS